MKKLAFASAVLGMIVLTSCTSSTEKKSAEPAKPATTEPAPLPPAATYKVRFDTSKGPIVVEVHPDWAPIGAKRFEDLVKDKYFDGARFFRVVPNFVIQFGIAGSPALTKKWDKPIQDDPVKQTNRRGSLVYAKTEMPNSRTTQLFINLASNQILDTQGFAPFAMVIEGMDIVDKLYAGDGERPEQEAITKLGNAYLTKNFPNLDFIKKATIL